jgi:hypothetical protein
VRLRKYAIIVSEEIVSQPSIEQAMDEEQTGSFQVRYFDDSAKATNRLLRQ